MNNDLIKSTKYEMMPTGIRFAPSLKFAEWEGLGKMLSMVHKAGDFWLGDWVNHGEAFYGEKYAQALSETDFAYQTLANAASVARKIPMERRRKGLSWAIHSAVASLSPQDQDAWLDRAEGEHLNVSQLRSLIKGKNMGDVVSVVTSITSELNSERTFNVYRKDYEKVLGRMEKLQEEIIKK